MITKVDMIIDHFGRQYTSGKFGTDGPWDVTGEDIIALFDAGYDVAVCHAHQVQPTKKQRALGVPPVPDKVFIMLDEAGGRFHQR